jgi:hypothetical protein
MDLLNFITMQQQNAAYSFYPQPLTKNYFRAVAKKTGGENRVQRYYKKRPFERTHKKKDVT